MSLQDQKKLGDSETTVDVINQAMLDIFDRPAMASPSYHEDQRINCGDSQLNEITVTTRDGETIPARAGGKGEFHWHEFSWEIYYLKTSEFRVRNMIEMLRDCATDNGVRGLSSYAFSISQGEYDACVILKLKVKSFMA